MPLDGRTLSAQAISAALDGAPCGSGWKAHCPAHDDSTPSLSISEIGGKVLVKCHAGCSQAEVLAAMRHRSLWWSRGARPIGPEPQLVTDDGAAARQSYAISLWETAMDARGTLAERYLGARGVTISPPAALRYRPALKHTPTGLWWPAMIGLIADVWGNHTAVHRTYLSPDGTGKADVSVGPQKMTLGPCGGGAVRLAEPIDGTLVLAEGIETALSIMQVRGTAAWATLGTSGMRSVILPPEVRDVIIAPDGDAAGEKAARNAALRLKREGRRVRIVWPPKGRDFNDALARESLR